MGQPMGIYWGNRAGKRKHRWLFKIPGVCDDGVTMLPPQRAARPDIKWKEMNIQHLAEEVYFAAKPDWTPIQITLYDLCTNGPHPVFEWLKKMYDPQKGTMKFPASFVMQVTLDLYDGCGNTVESWVYDNAWPQTMNFHDLDMTSNDIVTCDITLRYTRAYVQ
jgi:hypothetical protein